MKTDQNHGQLCQSCAMPMEKEEDFGTDHCGSANKEYCCHCFKSGQFTEPNITLPQMVDKVAGIMTKMKMSSFSIEQVKKTIPTLKRWQKQQKTRGCCSCG
ncbi:MAG: zinc ribbon domain-containing protein [Gammaproteobacteria bacterium]|nr:zinc ribbon domain-containing protein [Gammaproteobacteria bacterium]